MRIKGDIKKIGYFWLPQDEEKKIPGTLTISDGGIVDLEVIGLFDDRIEALNGNDDLGRIIGHVDNDGLVTLEKCFYKTRNFAFGGIVKSQVHVNKLICGVAYNKDEEILFNTVSFSVEGINEWISITGIDVSYSSDYKSASISYSAQEKLIYNLNNGFKLHVMFGYTLPGFHNTTEARIKQQTYFKLTTEVAKDFSEFSNTINQMTYLIGFAVDSSVTISDVFATSNSVITEISDGNTRPVNIKLFYPSLPFSKKEPKIDVHRMLFRFSDIREIAEKVFNNWLDTYLLIRPSLGLYFSAVSGGHKYLDGRFLALAQGLETYHRRTSNETLRDETEFRSVVASLVWKCPKQERKWLLARLYHGNEINLGQRIKKIIEPYKSYLGNSKQRNKIVRGVVDTRNYLTHYSEELEEKAAKGIDLWELCQKMEAVFQLHLLQQLGFQKLEIERILRNNYKLKSKFG